MMQCFRISWWCLGWCLLTPVFVFAQTSDNQFREIIRTTEPLTPQAEQKSFTLPPGFEIQLFASEAEIQKPLNMAFDMKGRLWITDSSEYPYPVKPGARGKDTKDSGRYRWRWTI